MDAGGIRTDLRTRQMERAKDSHASGPRRARLWDKNADGADRAGLHGAILRSGSLDGSGKRSERPGGSQYLPLRGPNESGAVRTPIRVRSRHAVLAPRVRIVDGQ